MLLLAHVDENKCIGCTLCLAACPHDAILGASQQMHSVLTEECTGCGHCLAPCPMQCIELRPTGVPALSPARTLKAQQREQAKQERLKRQLQGQKAILSHLLYLDLPEESREAKFQETIEKALLIAKAKPKPTWPKEN